MTSPLRWINFPVRDGKGIQMPADDSTPQIVPDTCAFQHPPTPRHHVFVPQSIGTVTFGTFRGRP